MLGDTGNKQAVRILLECILVLNQSVTNLRRCRRTDPTSPSPATHPLPATHLLHKRPKMLSISCSILMLPPMRNVGSAPVNILNSKSLYVWCTVADLRGRGCVGRASPLGVQILSISCSFWENLAKSYVGAPPPHRRVGARTLEKSWIRHWCRTQEVFSCGVGIVSSDVYDLIQVGNG